MGARMGHLPQQEIGQKGRRGWGEGELAAEMNVPANRITLYDKKNTREERRMGAADTEGLYNNEREREGVSTRKKERRDCSRRGASIQVAGCPTMTGGGEEI